jgi:hypothetical protein
MSSSKSNTSLITKLVPEQKVKLESLLLKKGVKHLERHTILVNGNVSDLGRFVNKDDEIIVLPILKGG